MPDLDLITANGRLRFFTLLHDARPVLLNLEAQQGPADALTIWFGPPAAGARER
jgi:hypothetical protein